MARPKTLSAAKGWTGIPAPMDAPAGGGGPGNFAPARPTGLNTFQAPPLFEPDPLITEGRKVLQPYPLLIKQRTGSECWAASLSSFLMTTRPNESARYSIDSIIKRVRDLERRTNEERRKEGKETVQYLLPANGLNFESDIYWRNVLKEFDLTCEYFSKGALKFYDIKMAIDNSLYIIMSYLDPDWTRTRSDGKIEVFLHGVVIYGYIDNGYTAKVLCCDPDGPIMRRFLLFDDFQYWLTKAWRKEAAAYP